MVIEALNGNRSIIQNNIGFKADTEENIKSELVKSPQNDEFQKETQTATAVKPNKKKHLGRNICLGVISALVLLYGSIVLKRKLSKPSFEEVQRCFKEIFERDLSKEETQQLIAKYKELCQNNNTEDFAKKMIETLKKDYGIEQVKTDVTVSKLKDDSLKTALTHTEAGSASPFGKIQIMPNTSSDHLIRNVQKEIFDTGFHELKHLKQFADAYRTNPDMFAESLYKQSITEEIQRKQLTDFKKNLREEMENLRKTDPDCSHFSVEELIEMAFEKQGLKSDNDILELFKKENLADIRRLLDERFGSLEPFKEGSEEYKKGLEYIKGCEKYPDPKVDYDAYRENILEKEAFDVGEKAQKIYNYLSSIWKI